MLTAKQPCVSILTGRPTISQVFGDFMACSEAGTEDWKAVRDKPSVFHALAYQFHFYGPLSLTYLSF